MFEDSKGNIWFGNNGDGVFIYDGNTLKNFNELISRSKLNLLNDEKSNPYNLDRIYSINEDDSGNIWIGTIDSGIWKYDESNVTNYTTKNGLSSNAVNTILKDNKGELWFGTDSDGIFKCINSRNTKSFQK